MGRNVALRPVDYVDPGRDELEAEQIMRGGWIDTVIARS